MSAESDRNRFARMRCGYGQGDPADGTCQTGHCSCWRETEAAYGTQYSYQDSDRKPQWWLGEGDWEVYDYIYKERKEPGECGCRYKTYCECRPDDVTVRFVVGYRWRIPFTAMLTESVGYCTRDGR